MVAYPHNTGGIIDALRTLASLMGGGSDLSIEITAGEALTAGEAVYINSTDSKIYKAENDDTREKATVFGIISADTALDAAGEVIVRGKATTTNTSLTIGLEYYLDATSGAITATAPSASGDYSVALGQAISATQLNVHTRIPVELV